VKLSEKKKNSICRPTKEEHGRVRNVMEKEVYLNVAKDARRKR
jgi:hypothetical protein